MKVLNWRRIGKGAQLGVCDVVLDVGHRRSLTILECSVLIASNGRVWVSLPSRPIFDRATGKVTLDQKTGKVAYTPFAKWPDRDTSDQFSKSVIKLLLDQHPDALGEKGGNGYGVYRYRAASAEDRRSPRFPR